MKAVVTKAFLGVKDGDVYPQEVQPGEVVEGELAINAVAAKWANELRDDSPTQAPKAIDGAPQNKSLTKKLLSFLNND